MSKRKCISVLFLILWIFLALFTIILLVVLGIKTHKFGFTCVEKSWITWYYIYCIFGAVATIAAVFVALFKEDLISLLHSPDLRVDATSESILPLIGVTNASTELDYYKCELRLSNKGEADARKCALIINSFAYDISRIQDYPSTHLDLGALNRTYGIGDETEQIMAGLDMPIELFRIINPSQAQTPEGVKDNSNAQISFTKLNIPNSVVNEGNYLIDYEVRSENSKTIKFSLNIHWTGKWDDDVIKMKENIQVKFTSK